METVTQIHAGPLCVGGDGRPMLFGDIGGLGLEF
jgi:hypothetical protein